MHEWGDEWFEQHGATLNEAIGFIQNRFEYQTGEYLSMKEKYGTVRYELLWLHSEQELLILKALIEEAAEKFPTVRTEILADSYFEGHGDTL